MFDYRKIIKKEKSRRNLSRLNYGIYNIKSYFSYGKRDTEICRFTSKYLSLTYNTHFLRT